MSEKAQSKDNISQTDSTCSSAKNDSVQTVLHNDSVRYVQKGYGLIMAVVIFIAFFSISPIVMKAIWPYIINLGDQKPVQAMVTLMFPQLIILVGNLMMWAIYVGKIPFFERYRVNNKKWDWEIDSAKWRKTLKRSIYLILFNQYCVVGPSILLQIYVIGSTVRWDMESFPGYKEILVQMVFFMFMEDLSFYFAHRSLHVPFLYKKIHKIHHEFNNTVSIASSHAHPIEYLFGNSIPMSLGYLILGNKCHFATYMIWIVLRIFETIDGHCGYEFSWSPYRLLPLSGSSEYHNFHHSHNIGTFCSFFTYLDTLFGTNKEYYQWKAKKEREAALNQLRKDHDNKVKSN